jgi:hypothetical protein
MPVPERKPHLSREAEEARQMRAAAERVWTDLPQVPRPLQAAVAHTLHAAATELENGRPLPREIRRAATHTVQAIGESITTTG